MSAFWPKGDINGDESRLESINYAYETPANDPKRTFIIVKTVIISSLALIIPAVY